MSIIGTLPENWETIEFQKIIEGKIRHGLYKPSKHFGKGTKILKMGLQYSSFRIGNQEMERVELNESEFNRFEVKTGDLLFSRTSMMAEGAGKCSIAIDHNAPFVFDSNILCITLKKDAADPLFYLYFFNSPIGKYITHTITEGTQSRSLTSSSLNKVQVPFPPLPTQHRIAHILGSLDNKIELNRQMNETLEAIARAIFKSWFVDFDPVRAKAEGRQPTGMDAETAALFPDGFESVEGREVPRGWNVKPLSESFNVIMGQSPPGTTYNENGEGMPFFQGRADFGFRYPSVRVYCTAPTRFAEAGDTMVSVRAPVGDINLAPEKCSIGRGVASVRHKTGSRSFTYYQMQSFKETFSVFESEGTVFGSMGKTDFNSMECISPPDEIVRKFEEIVFLDDQMIENNEQQSRSLAQIRDTLLPKLMSG